MSARIGEHHGPYVLRDMDGRLWIRRQDPDGRERSVGYIDGIAEWHRFCARLAAGDDEVTAFRALDAPAPGIGIGERA